MLDNSHTPTITAEPLRETIERVRTLDHYLGAQIIAALTDGWFCATDLVEERLDDALRHIMTPYSPAQQIAATHDRHVAAAFLINSYTWALPAAAIGAYLAERRVPDLAATNVAVRLNAPTIGGVLEIAFLSGRMAVLPNDPAANRADVVVLPNDEHLREWLRVQLEQHLAPLIAAVQRRTGLGRRAQWSLAADSCAALFLLAATALGDVAHGQREGLKFVQAAHSALRNKRTGFFTLTSGDRCETFRQRGGCCLFYKLPEGSNCSTCSLITPTERDQRLLEWMNQEKDGA